MLQKLLKHKTEIVLIVCIVFIFSLLRFFETKLFYDPFLNYFKTDYLNLPFPDFEGVILFSNMFMRYFINSFLSVLILYLLFKNLSLIKFVAVLYITLFVILISAFYFIIFILDESYNFLLFYLRRFLIQPLFLILFIPAFYLQKKQE
jgi:exosortase F-associated protein